MLFILAGNGLRLFAAYSADSFLTAVIFSSSASVQPFLGSPHPFLPWQPKKEKPMVLKSESPLVKESSTVMLDI